MIENNRIKKPVKTVTMMCTVYAITPIKLQKHVSAVPQQLPLKKTKRHLCHANKLENTVE